MALERVRAWFEVWTPLLSPWFVPITVAIFGLLLNSTVAESQTSAEYVRLAVEILSDDRPPSGDEDVALADRALRSWAVDVFVENSRVPLDDGVEDALRSGELVFGGSPPSAGRDGPLPEGQCTIRNFVEREVFAEPSPVSEEVGRLDAGPEEHAAFELRTFRPTGQQFIRVEEGWVEFFPFLVFLDCGDYDPAVPSREQSGGSE